MGLVGLILALRDVGFTLREMKAFIASRSDGLHAWRELGQRKLAELDERIAQAQAARTAIAHALACQHEDILNCPNFASVIAARVAGSPLEGAHPHERPRSPQKPTAPATTHQPVPALAAREALTARRWA